MPYSIQVEGEIVVSRFSGDVTIEELRRAKKELPRVPDFSPDLPHLIDFTNASVVNLPSAALRGLAEEASVIPSALQVIVAPRDITFGLARMFQSLSEVTGRNVRVVRSEGEARALIAARIREDTERTG